MLTAAAVAVLILAAGCVVLARQDRGDPLPTTPRTDVAAAYQAAVTTGRDLHAAQKLLRLTGAGDARASLATRGQRTDSGRRP
jgi:hypothetical protein